MWVLVLVVVLFGCRLIGCCVLCVGCVVLFDWGVGWVLWVVMVLLGFVAVIRWLVVEVERGQVETLKQRMAPGDPSKP